MITDTFNINLLLFQLQAEDHTYIINSHQEYKNP
jgi:hypothetical protein